MVVYFSPWLLAGIAISAAIAIGGLQAPAHRLPRP